LAIRISVDCLDWIIRHYSHHHSNSNNNDVGDDVTEEIIVTKSCVRNQDTDCKVSF